MPPFRRLLRLALIGCLFFGVMGLSALGVLCRLIWPTLPAVESLREVKLQVPLSVYTEDDRLIALFGETRRYPVTIDQVPLQLQQAFIAAEDARFHEHPGIDYKGIARAVWLIIKTGDKRVPGGSTITQQVAKQFFLSPEVTFTRKFTEILLALKMERELSKDEILALYLNKGFFGNRAYGIAAAAQFYYGKTLEELTLEESAMLASIPKFPSSANPLVNPSRAMLRRGYVLDRMLDNGFIDAPTHAEAMARPDLAAPHEPPVEVEAPWVAEQVRQDAVERFGDMALNDGYRVWTTLDGRMQEGANQAVRRGLLDYDQRHGWRGAEARVELPEVDDPAQWPALLRERRPIGGLQPAIVLDTADSHAVLALGDGSTVELPMAGIAWARAYQSENARGPAPAKPADVLARGDVVRLASDEEGGWRLAQMPVAQAAVVAIEHDSGAIRALTGGFSFALSKFNRVTQSQRQPGSSFKPFVYAAAFERGFTPASIVLDAPVVFNDTGQGRSWRPQNDNQTFAGPMRLRNAMVTSRNLVSVRVLDAVGVGFARRYIENFGFAPETLHANLSLALGTNAAPPIAMARGMAVFANGGYLVDPWVVQRIEDRDGLTIFEATPARACPHCAQRGEASRGGAAEDGFDLGPVRQPAAPAEEAEPDPAIPVQLAPQAIDPRTAYLVHSLLRDVVRRGTGRGALALGRSDIGGKTGTTNDFRDAWFSGFGGSLSVTAWMGMDDFSSLGNREFAARTALPIWVDFMKVALDGQPERLPPMPNGIATALIDPDSGRLVPSGTPGAISEIFRVEDLARLERQTDRDEQADPREAFDIF
ncbi:MAG: penicillin-binding protein 1A [Lysobacteraceae bacterium]